MMDVNRNWKVTLNSDGGATIKSPTGGYIASVQWRGNAPVIAAAPELLDALEYMVRMGEAEGWSDFILSDAHAAIDKARKPA